MRIFLAANVFWLLVALVVTPVSAQSPSPGYDANMPRPGPYEANLDALAAAHDTDALNRAVLFDVKDMPTATRALNWLRARQIAYGGSSHIAYLYSALSWRVSESLPEPHKANLKQNAVAQFMLAKRLIESEGFQCADGGAPGARWALVNSQLKVIAQYGSQLPPSTATSMSRSTLALMVLSFKERENDVWLCRGGAGYAVKYFEKHPDEKGVEVSIPGSIGANRQLPLDPTIIPDFVPYDRWKEKRHAAIDQFFKQIGGVPPSNYLDAEHRMK